MRVVEASHVVRLRAKDFWALKVDTSFDRLCAESEGDRFTLRSIRHSADAQGAKTIELETETVADQSPLPHALNTLLGAHEFVLVSHMRWWPERYDRHHPSTFEMRPRMMRDRAQIHGQSWVEEAGEECRVFYRVEIECHLWYQTLSKLLEAGFEKRLRDSYAKGKFVPEPRTCR